MDVAWRFEVRAPRSVDPTEATVLTPAAGAPHSDAFRMVTVTGQVGWRYARLEVDGREGRFDPLTRKLDTGQFTLVVDDDRTTAGGTNLERWVTAFLGNAQGIDILIGCRLVLWQSLDGGTTWPGTPYATLRITGVSTDGRRRMKLVARTLVEELEADCFIGVPHSSITYARATRLWPVTRAAVTYGPWTADTIRVPVAAAEVYAGIGARLGIQRVAGLVDATKGDGWNLVTEALLERVATWGKVFPVASLDTAERHRVRARIAWTSGALNGQTKDYWATAVRNSAFGKQARFLLEVAIVPVVSTDPNYGALPAAGDTGNAELLMADGPTPAGPLYLDSVHPAQLLKDLLDGKFGYLKDDGSPLRSWAYDATALNARIADTSVPVQRFVIEKRWVLREFIEQQLLLTAQLGWRLNTTGQVVVFDARLPTSVGGLPTIGDADIDHPAEAPGWVHERDGAITRLEVKHYTDAEVENEELDQSLASDQVPAWPPTLVRSIENRLIRDLYGRYEDLGEKALVIDGQGLRASGQDTDKVGSQQRSSWLRAILLNLIQSFERPWGVAPMYITLPCSRTATVLALAPGQRALLAVSEIPDPGTHRRGGTRLVWVLEKSERGRRVLLRCLDQGVSGAAAVPVLGTPTKDGTNPNARVNLPITRNAASDPVVIQVAVTDTSVGTAPAASSSLWVHAGIARSNGTAGLVPYPAGRRIWMRARSEPTPVVGDLKLPSAWVSSTPAFIDLDAYPAVTGLAASGITGTTATLTWTNTRTALPIEVRLAGVRIARLPAGSVRHIATGLTLNTAGQVLGVRYIDDHGGIGTDATVSVTTTATQPTAPAATGLRVVAGTAS